MKLIFQVIATYNNKIYPVSLVNKIVYKSYERKSLCVFMQHYFVNIMKEFCYSPLNSTFYSHGCVIFLSIIWQSFSLCTESMRLLFFHVRYSIFQLFISPYISIWIYHKLLWNHLYTCVIKISCLGKIYFLRKILLVLTSGDQTAIACQSGIFAGNLAHINVTNLILARRSSNTTIHEEISLILKILITSTSKLKWWLIFSH